MHQDDGKAGARFFMEWLDSIIGREMRHDGYFRLCERLFLSEIVHRAFSGVQSDCHRIDLNRVITRTSILVLIRQAA